MHRFAYTLVTRLDQADAPAAGNRRLDLAETLMLPGEGPRYVRHLRLTAEGDGRVVLTAGARRNLALVQTLDLQRLPGLPARMLARVGGLLSAGQAVCEVLVSRQDRIFLVSVMEDYDKDAPDAPRPFVHAFQLDLDDLADGPCRVQVNGIERRFLHRQ